MKLLRVCLITLWGGLIAGVHATTVIPPSFDQLVGDAELIFEGTVSSTQSQWLGQGAERVIVTYVTFDVQESIKGAAEGRYIIRMLGGTIDGETAEVADAPRFKVGDRDILFVEHNGSQFVPLVGIMHGRFHVQKEASGRNVVTKDDGAGVADVAKLGIDEKGAVSGRALSVDDFKSVVRRKLKQLRLVK